jgi:cytochrome oxidase Cu insertion factor (SCO1/SenC/PrrC family)
VGRRNYGAILKPFAVRAARGLLVASLLCGMAAVSAGGTPASVFRTETRVAEHVLPDAELRLGDGRIMLLSTLWRERPLLLTLFYRHCAGTCIPSLLLIRDAAARSGALGRDFRVLALSFANSDTAEDMRTQAAALGLQNDPNWLFAVGRTEDVQRIADALGFWFRRDLVTGQYDHPTLLVAVDQGRVVRALLGYPIPAERFGELVWELRGRFVPYYRLPGQSWLRCFEFNGRTGAMRPDWGLLLLLAPGMTAIFVAIGVFAYPARPGESSVFWQPGPIASEARDDTPRL